MEEVEDPRTKWQSVASQFHEWFQPAGTDSTKISWLKHYLDTKFHIKDIGKIKYFLSIEVARSSNGVTLSQRKYVLDILTECGLTDFKPTSSPMAEQHQLDLNSGELCDDPGQYRRLIGELLYLTITRPDISYAVHILSQFKHKPRRPHYDVAMRVLCYLKNLPGQGILLSSDSSLSPCAYCNADWADCPTTCRSTIGYIVFLGSSPISWRSNKQSIVSCSTAEAEYMAMTTTASEIIWLLRLISDLRYQFADIGTKARGQERFHSLLGKLAISTSHAST
ncbi:hypothetical protein RJ640_030646 [Escallonia rubra]|uniref:Reverse transcriptase Ty1/copia-type domain-containing protein n=1 Tax=Escallonia rubra TaxID=112253 RepID=A0AA88RRL2_9ASTE|nr:hypothetical protein RJ640_030646 [Escallonia rubra]